MRIAVVITVVVLIFFLSIDFQNVDMILNVPLLISSSGRI